MDSNKQNHFMQAKLDTALSIIRLMKECGYYTKLTEGYQALDRALIELNSVEHYLVVEEDKK